MKKRRGGLWILLFYCFPFVYIAMLMDFMTYSMIGYVPALIILLSAAFFGKLSNQPWAVVLGNILSFLLSLYCVRGMNGNEYWQGFFKPLYAEVVLAAVTLILILFQYIVMRYAKKLNFRQVQKAVMYTQKTFWLTILLAVLSALFICLIMEICMQNT